VGPQSVRLTVAAGVTVKGAKLLVAGKAVPVERSGSVLTFTVPSVLDHEAVALDI